MHVRIPESLEEELTERLEAVERLLTAHRWERAALVYAFTRDGDQGERVDLTPGDVTTGLTPREFAGLGIAGLRSDQTVRRYRAAWKEAIEKFGAPEVAPGDTVELPEEEFPKVDRGREGDFHSRYGPEFVAYSTARAMRDDSETADAIAEHIARDALLSAKVIGKVKEKRLEERDEVTADGHDGGDHETQLSRGVEDPEVADGDAEDVGKNRGPSANVIDNAKENRLAEGEEVTADESRDRRDQEKQRARELVRDVKLVRVTLEQIVEQTSTREPHVDGSQRGELLDDIEAIRNALDHIESGLRHGPRVETAIATLAS